MKEALAIFIGGGLGSLARFGIGKWINQSVASPFPFGTLSVNMLACLVLGIIIGLAETKQLLSPANRLFWAVGFCGGFSTFSTFSAETLYLFQKNQSSSALLYIFGSIIICLAATFGGQLLASKI